MRGRKIFEDPFPGARHLEINLSLINRIAFPHDEVFLRQAVSEASRAVVPDLEAFRQFTHRDMIPPRKALDREQCLMLLRGQARRLRRVFTKAKKLAQGIPKIGEHLIIGF